MDMNMNMDIDDGGRMEECGNGDDIEIEEDGDDLSEVSYSESHHTNSNSESMNTDTPYDTYTPYETETEGEGEGETEGDEMIDEDHEEEDHEEEDQMEGETQKKSNHQKKDDPPLRRLTRRIQSTKKSDELYDEDFDDVSDDGSFDIGDEQDNSPTGKYFYDRLVEFLLECKAEGDVRNDWRVKVSGISRGPAKGVLDICYHNRKGRKYRSRVDVAMALNILPPTRTVKSMPRYMHAMLAVETRERFLISELLFSHPNPDTIVEFYRDGDSMRARCIVHPPSSDTHRMDSASAQSTPFDASIHREDAERAQCATSLNGGNESVSTTPHKPGDEEDFNKTNFFSYGNTTVLNWGRIVPSCHFHNNAHLFPLGFKCIRQEHDTILDRIVDCLCEIDYVSHSDPHGVRIPYEEMDTKAKADLRPVFRITVAWEVGSRCRQVVRVYEGKTPQLVWQSVMLESVGLKGTVIDGGLTARTPDDEESATDTEGGAVGTQEATGPVEEMDEEEKILRSKLMDVRRLHMRALSTGQSNGGLHPVKPRLGLDSVDSLVDVGILRMLEGMAGAEESALYQFLDSRSTDPVKRVVLKNLTDMGEKVKGLDKVASKNTTRLVLIEQEKERVQRKAEDMELRRKSRDELRNERLKRLVVEQKRRMRARELERIVRTMRDEEMKLMHSRRIYSRMRLEMLSRQEEMHASNYRRMIEEEKNIQEQADSQPLHDTPSEVNTANEALSSKFRDTSVYPLGRPVRLGGAVFGQSLDLWLFLVSFSKPLSLAAVPSQEVLESSLSACESSMTHLQHMLKRARGTIGCTAVDSMLSTPSLADAEAMLCKIGIALCKPLMQEFNKIMTLESVEQFLGDNRVELNALTWKEIARILLTHTLCTQFGMNDFESMTTLRGRGHTTAPDTGDRRSLRLIRRRILFRYSQSIWRQTEGCGSGHPAPDTLCGKMYTHLGREVSSGLVVRIPAPSTFTRVPFGTNTSVSTYTQIVLIWCELYYHLLQLGRVSDQEFFSSHVLTAAQFCVGLLEIYIQEAGRHIDIQLVAMKAIKMCMRMKCSSEDYFHQLRSILLLVLYRLVENSNAGIDRSTLCCVRDVLRIPLPPVYSVGNVNDFLSTPGRQLHRTLYEWSCSDTSGRPVEMSWTMSDLCSLDAGWIHSVSPLMVYNTLVNHGWSPVARKKELHEDSITKENSSDDLAQNSITGAEEKMDLEDSEEDVDPDLDKVKSMPTATQRSYFMISTLMDHPLADQFNSPVDASAVKGYYDKIRNPICLLDVREHLINGKYGSRLVDIYRDIMLVFQNSMAFSTDATQLAQSTMKMICVFERMFYESVLNTTAPLEQSDNCLVCRSTYENDEKRTVLCDRCDAPYHMDCLSPPMHAPPRGEWFCQCCVEERHVQHVHPLRNALVWEPTSPVSDREIGRVVGIVRKEGYKPRSKVGHVPANTSDSIEFTNAAGGTEVSESEDDIVWYLEYHIEFGYSLDDIPFMGDIQVIGRGGTRTVVWVLDDVLTFYYGDLKTLQRITHQTVVDGENTSSEDVVIPEFKPVSPPVLPSGYTFHEYDSVAALCRAYEGWVHFHSALPGSVDESFSARACKVLQKDDRIRIISRAAAILSTRCGNFAMRGEDWTTVLLALSYKAISTPAFIESGHYMDEITSADYARVLRDIGENRPPTLLDYKSKLNVKVGNKLLFVDEAAEDDDDDGMDRGTSGTEGCDNNADVVKSESRVEEKGASDIGNRVENDDNTSSAEGVWDEGLEAAAQSQGSISESDGFPSDGGADDDQENLVSDDDSEDPLFSHAELEEINQVSFEEKEQCESKESENGEKCDNNHELDTQDKSRSMPPPSGPPSTSEKPILAIDELKHSWETRYRSNRRGKEDAMFTLTLMEKIEGELAQSEEVFREKVEETSEPTVRGGDEENKDNGISEESNKTLNREGAVRLPSATVAHLAPGCILHTVVKSTLPRPADDIDMKEWLASFNDRFHDGAKEIISINDDSKLTSVSRVDSGEGCGAMDVNSESSIVTEKYGADSVPVCAWCGFTEKMICSQLVYGQTWDEWKEWQAVVDRKREEGKFDEVPKRLIAFWVPLNNTDAARLLEAARISSCKDETKTDEEIFSRILIPPKDIKMEVIKGSVVVHECCAESMHVSRITAHNKLVEREKERERIRLHLRRQAEVQAAMRIDIAEDRRLADVLYGIARGKVISLGYDHYGNVYYVFPGTKSLYVCTTEYSDTSSSKEGSRGCSSTDSPIHTESSQSDERGGTDSRSCSNTLELPDPVVPDGTCLKWRVLESVPDIAHIILTLNDSYRTEKTIKRALRVLYKDAADLSMQIEKNNSVSDLYESGERESSPLEFLMRTEEYTTLVRDSADHSVEEEETEHPTLNVVEEKPSSVEDDEHDMEVDTKGTATDNEGDEEDDDEAELEGCDMVSERSVPLLREKRKRSSSPRVSLDDTKRQCVRSTSEAPSSNGTEGEPLYLAGSRVFVRRGEKWWEGKVTNIRTRQASGVSDSLECQLNAVLYKIRFSGWGAEYDIWVGEESLLPRNQSTRAVIQEHNENSEELDSAPGSIPEILKSLTAYKYYASSRRHNINAVGGTPLNCRIFPRHNKDKSDIAVIKSAMLLVHAALPYGSIDESEERWGRGVPGVGSGVIMPLRYESSPFSEAWKYAVTSAADATQLMECQLMLEYGVRSSWFKTTGAKLMCCMPSRLCALRHSTLGMVAMRLFCLDQAVKYDKVKIDDEPIFDEEEDSVRSKASQKKSKSSKSKSKKK